jgi:hypothetical protein
MKLNVLHCNISHPLYAERVAGEMIMVSKNRIISMEKPFTLGSLGTHLCSVDHGAF